MFFLRIKPGPNKRGGRLRLRFRFFEMFFLRIKPGPNKRGGMLRLRLMFRFFEMRLRG
jgi:hypothetical protein